MYNIALAIGHNFAWKSKDRGASGNGVTEADTTKNIVDEIVRRGIPWFTIKKVPEWLDIKWRNKWVNDRSKELHAYFEFHLDSATPTASWVTTFFRDGNWWARWEAIQYQKEYTRITGLPGRWVKSDVQTRFGRLWAIRDIKIFWLLMEMWFISNVWDVKTVQSKWVEWVIAGIKSMFAS